MDFDSKKLQSVIDSMWSEPEGEFSIVISKEGLMNYLGLTEEEFDAHLEGLK